jgi:NAD(P)-dependent dehydrogenase (short-subunit alcohol dehydrogenase family)
MPGETSTQPASHDQGSPLSLSRINAMVVGGGAIGSAIATALLASDNLARLIVLRRSERDVLDDPRVSYLSFDAGSGDNLPALEGTGVERLHLLVNTVGLLHGAGQRPEKRLRDLNLDNLLRSMTINAALLPRLAQAYGQALRHDEPAILASLSARVGSIEDNHLGGWYSYRASKAAHNMLLRTLAREWRVSHRNTAVVALHPGTVASPLSEPFVTDSYSKRVLQPGECAEALLGVLSGLGAADTGRFLDWRGEPIPW